MSERDVVLEMFKTLDALNVKIDKMKDDIKSLSMAMDKYREAVIDLSEKFKSYETRSQEKCMALFNSLEQEKIKMQHEIDTIKERVVSQKTTINGHDKKIDSLDSSTVDIGARLLMLDKEVREIKEIVQENSKINKINEKAIYEINNEFEWIKKLKNQFQTAIFALIIAVIMSSGVLIYTNFYTIKETKDSKVIKQELIDIIKEMRK